MRPVDTGTATERLHRTGVFPPTDIFDVGAWGPAKTCDARKLTVKKQSESSIRRAHRPQPFVLQNDSLRFLECHFANFCTGKVCRYRVIVFLLLANLSLVADHQAPSPAPFAFSPPVTTAPGTFFFWVNAFNVGTLTASQRSRTS